MGNKIVDLKFQIGGNIDLISRSLDKLVVILANLSD